jgi:hypothetical protein
MRMTSVSVALALVMMAGCGRGPSRIHPPSIDAVTAGNAAMKQYDRDGDGAVAGNEIDQAPSLKAALKTLDTDGDGRITAGEVTARIREWQASKLGLTTLQCEVTLDGAPLPGATVRYEPEAFLGPNVKPASGVTDELGIASLTIAESERQDPLVSGAQCGLYLVRITKDVNGQERIPPRYNAATTIGGEVAHDMEIGSVFVLQQ